MGDMAEREFENSIDEIVQHELHPEGEITAWQKHLREIDITAWQMGRGDWFTVRLFDLMSHADSINYYKLSAVFPEEGKAFDWWQSGAWEAARRTDG